MFFWLEPQRAILSDINESLIEMYKQVAHSASNVVGVLSKLPATQDAYYHYRAQRPTCPVERAARFIYLNRNCYGGLYRENQKGEFNVPYGGRGRNHQNLCTNGLMDKAARLLGQPGVSIRSCDFQEVITQAKAGDVVYCDPTYRQVTRDSFDRYGSRVFDWSDQKRLAQTVLAAHERGALVLVSNACSDEVRELYPNAVIVDLERPKGIGRRANPQGQREYLFVLDPLRIGDDWLSL